MFGSSFEPAPDSFDPPVGGSNAEPLVPQLIVLFGLRACWYESFPFDVQLPRIEPGRIVLPADEPGVASWSLDLGIELPVRHCGLTVGRYVLVPASPTTGVDFSPTSRAAAIAMVEPVGVLIAASMVAGNDGGAPYSGGRLATSGDVSMGARSHRRTVARHLRHTSRRGRGDLA